MTEQLKAPLHRLLRHPLNDEDVGRIRKRLVRSALRPPRASRGRVLALGVAAGVAATVFATVVYQSPQRAQIDSSQDVALVLADGSALATQSLDTSLGDVEARLMEGSSIFLSQGTKAQVLTNGAGRFVLSLGSGEAVLDVRPGGNRLWTVRAGDVDVDVVGTRFRVTRDRRQVVVTTERGEVLVRGGPVPDGERLLVAGESIAVAVVQGGEGVAIARAERAQGISDPEDPIEGSAVPEGVATASAKLGPTADGAVGAWRKLAAERAFGEAYDLLGSKGLGRAVKSAPGVQELFTLADVARLSGHPREAEAPLKRIVAEYSHDSRAPVAAFSLGRLYLDVLGRPSLAAQAFSKAIALGPPPSLREDAYARVVEAWDKEGNAAATRQAARRYLDRYPAGRHVDRVQTLAGSSSP